LLRNIEMITEDQLYTQPQPLREALAESVELTRLLNRRVADLEAHVMRLQAENDYLVVQLDKAVRQVEEAVRQAETYRSGMA
jgi:hypothetical protein